MYMTKKERLKKYWTAKGFSGAKAFAQHLGGIAESNISEVDKRADNSKLEAALLKHASDLNIDWWKTGDGDMIKQGLSSKEPLEGYSPNPDHMTLEQKLLWLGFKTKDIRQIQEWSKLSEEEQDEELQRLCMQNLKKGRF